MRNFSRFAVAFAVVAFARAASAEPTTTARGFAADRLYNAAPGSAYIVVDDLAMHGALGGAMSTVGQYAHDPFHVPDGRGGRLDVVTEQSSVNIGFAATFDRFKIYANFVSPITSTGHSGESHGVTYPAPNLSLTSNPDTIADLRLGFNVRVFGRYNGPFRAGLQLQLWVPSGDPHDYVTDAYYRAMNRVLIAGDADHWTYAANFGVQHRSTTELVPNGPRGPEFLFGAGGGRSFGLAPRVALAIGPEVFGQTAFRELFGHYTTGVEALGTVRVDWGRPWSPRLRLKAAAGGGLDAEFGTPAWRAVLSLDVMDFFTN